MTEHKFSAYFVTIVAIFITCLIVANIISVKLINIFGLIVPAGVIIFPMSYIAGDVLTEVYGFQRARRAIWLGFISATRSRRSIDIQRRVMQLSCGE